MLRGLRPLSRLKSQLKAQLKAISFANVARGLSKPVLIARVCKVTISIENFDELLGLQEDGPAVQHIKKNDDKIVLSFKDKASRYKAKTQKVIYYQKARMVQITKSLRLCLLLGNHIPRSCVSRTLTK